MGKAKEERAMKVLCGIVRTLNLGVAYYDCTIVGAVMSVTFDENTYTGHVRVAYLYDGEFLLDFKLDGVPQYFKIAGTGDEVMQAIRDFRKKSKISKGEYCFPIQDA